MNLDCSVYQMSLREFRVTARWTILFNILTIHISGRRYRVGKLLMSLSIEFEDISNGTTLDQVPEKKLFYLHVNASSHLVAKSSKLF